MKIIQNSELGTWTLVPVEADEEQVISAIAAMLKPEDKLLYGGREQDGDKFYTVRLHAGGREEERSETIGNSTVLCIVHLDSVKLILRGTTEEDKREVIRIRDTCYFSSGGLIFIGETEVDGKKAIITTAERCKHCGAGMIHYSDCEWSTCEACAAKCDHNYVRGAIHGGGAGIGVGEFCDKCGRGNPKAEGEREKSVIEHHLAAIQDGVVDAIFYDGFSGTPRQAVEVHRLVRRYNKSRRRAAQ